MKRPFLTEYRKRHGLNQAALGLALGIPQDTAQKRISQYEQGTRELPVYLAYRFIDLAAAQGEHYTLEDILPREMEAAF